MYATVRRYEGIDSERAVELTKKVNETFMPLVSKLPGFNGYFLVDTGDGVMSSIGIFDTPKQGEASARLTAEWVREEKLENVLQNPPNVTGGEVLVHRTNGALRA